MLSGDQLGDQLAWAPDCDGIGFVDQAPFFPNGPLRAALTFWNDKAETADVMQALVDAEAAGMLEGRPGGLDGTIGEGGAGFSSGEQQRLAIARALLNRPDWLFMDEPTAALPDEDQATLYRVLKEKLPDTTMISIGHRAGLAEFHARRLAWQGQVLS